MLSIVALLAAVLVQTPSVAQAGDADRAARFEAKGKKAYARKRWGDAIAAFDAAYRADKKPKYLFNIAKAYEQKGDLDKAVQYCERYVAEAEDKDDKTDGQDLLTMLKIKQEHAGEEDKKAAAAAPKAEPKAEPKPEPPPKKDPPPPPKETPPPAKKATGTPPPADMVKAAKERPSPPPDDGAKAKKGTPEGVTYLYYGAAGLFVGGLLVGALAKAAQDDRDSLQGTDEPVQLSEIDEKDATARDRAKAANALYLLSVVAAGAGAIWQVTSDSSAVVSPIPGGAVLTVRLP